MDKLRIAVFLNEDFDPKTGGGFSYYQRLVEKIDSFSFDKQIDICFLAKSYVNPESFKKQTIQIPYSEFKKVHWTLKSRLLFKLFSFSFLKHLKLQQKIKNRIEAKIASDEIIFLKQHKVDLVYYLTPDFYPINYPFVATHWDLGHKSMFAFPEVSLNKKIEKRENYHRLTLQKAFAIFAESMQSKTELIEYERINSNRIFVVPLFAGKVVELDVNESDQSSVLKEWDLKKEEFYFYPAQFWAHKNHFALINAFKLVVEKYPNMKLVLSGSDKGNLNYIKQLVENYQLSKNVIFTGFVSDETIFTFYKNATALVMPTYLGPTNMPLLEAYYLGCPVLCSDLQGHREQMADNAIYFNPSNSNDLANKMLQVVGIVKNKTIPISNTNVAEIINQHFLSLYNIRKTFGFDF